MYRNKSVIQFNSMMIFQSAQPSNNQIREMKKGAVNQHMQSESMPVRNTDTLGKVSI